MHNPYSVFHRIFWEKLYSGDINRKINKAIHVQTGNTSTVNVFNIKIFLLHKVGSVTFSLDDIRKATKKTLVSEFVTE